MTTTPSGPNRDLVIDLPDLTTAEARAASGISTPARPQAIPLLMRSTPARIGIGRAGLRYRTRPQLQFAADHAVTQDALFREVDPGLLSQLGLFEVRSQVADRREYLLRPDLGRKLSDDGQRLLRERCRMRPQVQLYVADGLSAAAIEHNIPNLLPALVEELGAAGVTLGTPFFAKNARVGLMNAVNAVVDAEVVVTLIGERPGLGRAEAMSAYLGYRPRPDSTDAERDAVCNIYNGGLNPLEAAAVLSELIQRILARKASGVAARTA